MKPVMPANATSPSTPLPTAPAEAANFDDVSVFDDDAAALTQAPVVMPSVPVTADSSDLTIALGPDSSEDTSLDDSTSVDTDVAPAALPVATAPTDNTPALQPFGGGGLAEFDADLNVGPVSASLASQVTFSATMAPPVVPSGILPDEPVASIVGSVGQAAAGVGSIVNSVLGPPAAAITGGGVSPFVINVTYDSSVNSAPPQFRAVIQSAIQFLESQFADPVAMNITVGYGEVGGNAMSPGALGENQTFLNSYTYAQLKNALIADAKSADDATAIATLPTSSPVNGTFWATTAEAKALGLLTPSTSIDGYAGFAAGNLFDYDNSNGVTAGLYDFYDVVLHELTEVMGRSLLVGGTIGSTANSYELLDLFHYSAAGTRDFVGTRPGYFSFNGGVTNMASFNTNPSGDFGDWASSVGPDSFLAFSNSGVINPVSQADIREMDVLGWNPAGAIVKPDLTASGLTFDGTTVHFQINNAGIGPAAASTAGVYLSTDGTITSADTLIATASVAALLPLASSSIGGSIALPTNLVTPGTYFLGALADSNGQIAESNESNNASNTLPVILGNAANNTLTGTAANDLMLSFAGNDALNGGAGADAMHGGTGNDSYTVDNAGDQVIENANEGTDTAFASISYTLPSNVEQLELTGAGAINATGNSLNNLIAGNGASNRLTGGAGADQFLFNTALNRTSNVDTITDFSHAAGDKIDLDHTIFTALTKVALGTAISARDFDASADGGVHRSTDHILYNTATGALSYDPDGSGAAAAVQFAIVANHPSLASSDFLLV